MRMDMSIITVGIRDITDCTLGDNTVKEWGFEITPEDVERFLGHSVVASIPEL
jgi:hypothetical protein